LYATHGEGRGQTGATMYLGRGSVIGVSKKQKLTDKSSTKCELVGVDNDAPPQMLWTRYFVEGQGYGEDRTYARKEVKVVVPQTVRKDKVLVPTGVYSQGY
jgi:hypothetical protein